MFLDNPLEQIISLLGHIKSRDDHVVCVLLQLLYALAPNIAEEHLHKRIPSHIYHARHGSAVLDARQHCLDPGIVLILVETAERQTKDQITDDVKGCPVVPGLHVQRLPFFAAVLQAAHQLVDIFHDQRLLRSNGSVAEAVAQCSSQALMFLLVRVDDRTGKGLNRGRGDARLGHLHLVVTIFVVSSAVAIDVLPCSRIGEGKVVRPDAHHGPILLVLPVRVECLNTDSLAESPRPWRCSRQQRPRDSAQRMEEDIVDNEAHLVGQDLLWWSARWHNACLPTGRRPAVGGSCNCRWWSDLTAPRMTTTTAPGPKGAPASTILFRIAIASTVCSLYRFEEDIQDTDVELWR